MKKSKYLLLLGIAIILFVTACTTINEIGKINMISNRNIDPNLKYQLISTYSGSSREEVKSSKAKNIEEAIDQTVKKVPGGEFLMNVKLFQIDKIYFAAVGDVWGVANNIAIRGFQTGNKVTWKRMGVFISGVISALKDDNTCFVKTGNETYEVKYTELTKSAENLDNNQIGEIVVGSKVNFKNDGKVVAGEIISIDNINRRAKISFLNIYGETDSKETGLNNISLLTQSQYELAINKQNEEIAKYKFTIGQKVSWIEEGISKIGLVSLLDSKSHKASIKFTDLYGDEQTKKVKYLSISALSDEQYSDEFEKLNKEIAKHKFIVGEKVVWLKNALFNNNQTIINAEVISIDELNNRASIKYIDAKNIERISQVDLLELSKIK